MSAPGTVDNLTSYRAAMGYALPRDENAVLALRQYYAGDQVQLSRVPAEVRDIIRTLARTQTGLGFSINVCSRVVDTLVGALNIVGLRADDRGAQDSCWEWWQAAQLQRVCGVSRRARNSRCRSRPSAA